MFYVVRRNEGDHLQNMLLVMNVSLSVMLIINCRVLGLTVNGMLVFNGNDSKGMGS